jgi:septal ring factor EnvC (AmiA/AmiB activator)
MEGEAAAARRELGQVEDRSAALLSQLQAAEREVYDARALLEATNSRSEVLEAAWNEALQASKVGPG